MDFANSLLSLPKRRDIRALVQPEMKSVIIVCAFPGGSGLYEVRKIGDHLVFIGDHGFMIRKAMEAGAVMEEWVCTKERLYCQSFIVTISSSRFMSFDIGFPCLKLRLFILW